MNGNQYIPIQAFAEGAQLTNVTIRSKATGGHLVVSDQNHRNNSFPVLKYRKNEDGSVSILQKCMRVTHANEGISYTYIWKEMLIQEFSELDVLI